MRRDYDMAIASAVQEEREKWEKRQIERVDNLYKETNISSTGTKLMAEETTRLY